MMADCSKDELISCEDKFLPTVGVLARNALTGIGMEGSIPWKCTLDMQMFKQLTTDSIMIMGRKTLESLPKVLDSNNRRSICISSKDGNDLVELQTKYPTVMFTCKTNVFDIEEEARLFFGIEFYSKRFFSVIGGRKIIKLLKGDICALFLSEIKDKSPCDVHFDSPEHFGRIISIMTPMFVDETNYDRMTVYGKPGILSSRFINTPNNGVVFNLIKTARFMLENHAIGNQ